VSGSVRSSSPSPAPSIYYGDEIGLTGALPDHWVRKIFPWDPPERRTWTRLPSHKALIALRRSPRPPDRRLRPLYDDPDIYAFARTLEGSMLIAAVNVAEGPRRFEIPLSGSLPAKPATPTILFATDGSPTAELALDALLLALHQAAHHPRRPPYGPAYLHAGT
jgi:hypothetical protein